MRLMASGSVFQNRCRDMRERQHLVHAIEFDGFLGHPEDDGARFILRNVESASLLHLKHSARAVISHAGKDDADSIGTGVARSGAKQHIDRRAMAANERTILDLDKIARAAARSSM